MIGTVGSGGQMSQWKIPAEARFEISEEDAERDRLQEMTQLFGPYLHCPILVPSDAAIEYVERNRSRVKGLETNTEESEPEYPVVWQCVQEAFPDGKGLATWKEVEDSVGYSRRQIVRAIKANTDYDTWAQGGHIP
ncbi:MAG: hypothetical protein AB3N13_02895 [Arenibacterium sp.]